MINRRRVIKAGKKYIDFADEEVKRVCCVAWGDCYVTTTTDNGDNTVTVTTRFVSKMNDSVKRNRVISKKVLDNTDGKYIAGTTYEAVGMTMKQIDAVTSVRGGLRKIVNSRFVQLTSDFNQDIPLYGYRLINSQSRKADCSSNYKTQAGNTFKLHHYYQYFGYIDGSSGIRRLGDNHLFNGYRYAFFGEYPDTRISGMGYFTGIDGYRPAQFNNISVYVLTDAV